MDGITDSMDMSLRKLQEMVKTGKPDVLQSMGSQRVQRLDKKARWEQAGKAPGVRLRK